MTEHTDTSTESKSKRTELELEQYLKDIAQAMVDAVNERNFDATTPPYAGHFSSGFTITAPLTGGQLNLDQYLNMLSELSATYPQWFFQIRDLSCSIRDKLSAVVFSNYEVNVTPPGIVKRGVGALYFSLQNGHWWAVAYEGHDGMEGTEGVF